MREDSLINVTSQSQNENHLVLNELLPLDCGHSWSKTSQGVSMVIAKTASRNVAFKTNVMSQAVLEAQSSFVTSEATDQDASSQRCSLNDGDVVCNADLHVFNHEVDNG